MTLANKFTIARLVMVIPFMGLMLTCLILSNIAPQYAKSNLRLYLWIASGSIFLVAMITDFIDGYIARKTDTVTTFGKLFDPLADKFMTTSALMFLATFRVVPIWVVVIFILRDILVDGGRNLAAKNNIDVSASIWGKSKTMLQTIGIMLIFFVVPILKIDFINIDKTQFFLNWQLTLINLPLLIALIFSIISGALYYKQITPFIKMK